MCINNTIMESDSSSSSSSLESISKRFIPQEKKRGAPARFQIVKLTPLGGTTATVNQRIRFHLPSNRVGSYLDAENSFISLSFNTNHAVSKLGGGGVGGFFSDVVLRNGGNHLSTISRFDVFRNYMVKNGSIPTDYADRDGKIMSGTYGASDDGGYVAGLDHTLVDPLSNYAPLFRSGSYIPLFSSSPLELELQFGQLVKNIDWMNDVNEPTILTFANIQLHLAIIEVDPRVDRQIIMANDSLFKYLVNNVSYFSHQISTNSTSSIFNIGASFSSANKVDVMMTLVNRPDPKMADDQVFMRTLLKKLSLMVDGQTVLTPYIECGEKAINLAYSRIAQHGLCDYSLTQSMDTSAKYISQSYIVSFDLETVLNNKDIRSGLNLSSSISQLQFEFSAAVGADVRVHVFVYHDAMVSMAVGPNSTRTFEVSI